MKIIAVSFSTVILILFTVSCTKKEIVRPAPAMDDTPNYFLDSVVWNNLHQTTYFKYRADSTPDKILYGFPLARDTVRFVYSENRIEQINSSRLSRASDYQYNAAGKIAVINMHSISGIGVRYILEFSYDNAGKPISLDYYLKNEVGKWLQYSSSYQYDTAGLLKKVTQITPGGIVITHVIEAYSDECEFNPWAFIDPITITESMTIYNLPVLQTMHKLPAKISTTFTGKVESIKHNQFSIQNNRIDKMISNVEFPTSPGNNYQAEVNFFYH